MPDYNNGITMPGEGAAPNDGWICWYSSGTSGDRNHSFFINNKNVGGNGGTFISHISMMFPIKKGDLFRAGGSGVLGYSVTFYPLK